MTAPPSRRPPGCAPTCSALLEAVRRGETDPAAALERLGELPFRDLGFARVDTHRELRQGAPEAILAEGKTAEEIEAHRAGAARRRARAACWSTRADAAARAALRRVAPDARGGRSGRGSPGSPAAVPARARARDDRLGRHLRRPGRDRGAGARRAARHARGRARRRRRGRPAPARAGARRPPTRRLRRRRRRPGRRARLGGRRARRAPR